MNIRIDVGSWVAFDRSDATISNHACGAFGIDFINDLKFFDCKFHKGTVTKIKTHSWLFFKLKNPIYIIDDYYLAEKVKPIITVHYKEWRSPSNSVYEADSYIMYEHKPVVE